MAWMLRLECCPLVRHQRDFRWPLWWIGIINPIKNWMGPSPKKNPGPSFGCVFEQKRYSVFFFFGGYFRSILSVSFFLEFSANFDDWKTTLEELRLGYSNLWDQTWNFSSVEGSKLANCSILAILCDLFGMVKWPFKRLSDLQLGDQKVTLNHLDSAVSLFSSIFNYNFSCCFMLFTASTLNSCFHWV